MPSWLRKLMGWLRQSTFGGFVASCSVLMLLAVAIWVVVKRIVWGPITSDEATRLQTFAVAVLLPAFEAVGTVVVATGILKSAVTAFNNRYRSDDKKEPIQFFKW